MFCSFHGLTVRRQISYTQICNVHMFACHTVVLPTVFGSAAYWSPWCRYKSSRGYMNMWSYHPWIFCSTQDDSNARSKVKTCCFDFVSCFCKRFLMQMAYSIPHTCWVLGSLLYIDVCLSIHPLHICQMACHSERQYIQELFLLDRKSYYKFFST